MRAWDGQFTGAQDRHANSYIQDFFNSFSIICLGFDFDFSRFSHGGHYWSMYKFILTLNGSMVGQPNLHLCFLWHHVVKLTLGVLCSIASRCSGRGPALLPARTSISRQSVPQNDIKDIHLPATIWKKLRWESPMFAWEYYKIKSSCALGGRWSKVWKRPKTEVRVETSRGLGLT